MSSTNVGTKFTEGGVWIGQQTVTVDFRATMTTIDPFYLCAPITFEKAWYLVKPQSTFLFPVELLCAMCQDCPC